MKNQAYWIKRAERRMDAYQIAAFDKANVIKKSYTHLQNYINSEIAKILRNVGDDTLAYSYRLKRLQALLSATEKKVNELYRLNLKTDTTLFKQLIENAYYQTIFDISQGIGYLPTFAPFNKRLVEQILNENWSGQNYSKRIWSNTDNLANELRQVMTNAAVSGESINKTTLAISKLFDSSYYCAERLIRTETTAQCNMAEIKAYESLDIDKYQFIATLDTRTSPQCRQLDGEIFDTSKARQGVNLPAMHPNCRSTTIAYFEDVKPQLRAAKDVEGNRIAVPSSMHYDDWYKKYVLHE